MDDVDGIALEEGRILLRYGLDDDGDPTWHVAVLGELPYITALGLVDEARRILPALYDMNEFG